MLWPRWLFLRALGLVFLSAFYALVFQVRGLIGERGILPAGDYLHELAVAVPGVRHLWYAPTLFWAGAGDRALMLVVALGLVASILLALNVAPRIAVAVCTLCFLSCIAVLQDFSAYQSDGMLLEAGFISIFFAPRGTRPRLGAHDPPSPISLFMLRWEWFRIYFESGVVKLASGDPHWRNLTAMDQYYENGPLPAWPGWYVQQLMPHWYHAATALLTLVVELGVVWALFLPRRFRVACFAIVTALQMGIIATANYAFLNYLVLVLGVLLLDDEAFAWLFRRSVPVVAAVRRATWATWGERVVLGWVFLATLAPVLGMLGLAPLLIPARTLEPFRIANSYGLFANMTEARYEIEFQGSRDGVSWRTYHFRYKPQDPMERPGIYAPYQPRFDWNLWFASLGPWRESPWVVIAQERLIEGSPTVLALFRDNPFPGAPPTQVRTVLWRYWFTDAATRRRTGAWWRREEIGPFAGTLGKTIEGGYALH
ncbi:MAG: lipase maturation factor family protein [Gemmatimonadaceae bacterium]|nr:lipase maturation factor family protein [Gemmatimonadaceae bacterium]NUQ91272.1 lipase maturation factor family protein [Gemmatimonadaceae bacterium]NUR18277.1 lipase maturation factor family protein [Gemmatimonadaceae bacterium]NUS95897.1 lipase maturation factor family protein [Gemmatimonadaceae bacterium]